LTYISFDPAVEYTAPSVQKNPIWADPDILGEKKFLWNQKDGKINRKSFVHDYKVESGRPLNPVGRTGMKGRGLLGEAELLGNEAKECKNKSES
jgi:ADP-ribose pyrophosphatase